MSDMELSLQAMPKIFNAKAQRHKGARYFENLGFPSWALVFAELQPSDIFLSFLPQIFCVFASWRPGVKFQLLVSG